MTAETGSVGVAVGVETANSSVGQVAAFSSMDLASGGRVAFGTVEVQNTTPDIVAQAEAIADTAWNNSNPMAPDVITQAEAVAREAWNATPEVPTYSPMEVQAQAMAMYAGLFGVRAESPEVTEEVIQSHQEIGLATNEVLVEVMETPTDTVVKGAVEELVEEVIAPNNPSIPLEVPQSELNAMTEQVLETVVEEATQPEQQAVVSESSDQAVAGRVATLAEEVGRPDIAEKAREMTEPQAQEEPASLEPQKEAEATEETSPSVQSVRSPINKEPRKVDRQQPKPPPEDQTAIRIDEGANGRRREILRETKDEEVIAAQKEERPVSAEKVAERFEEKAQADRGARSGLLNQLGVEAPDGGITEIAKDLQRAVEGVVSSHPAVVLAESGTVAPQKAVEEALNARGSRRYAPIV